jgi:hypothetical protein
VLRRLIPSGAFLATALGIAESGHADWKLVLATAFGSFAAFLAHAEVSEKRQRVIAQETVTAALREHEKACPWVIPARPGNAPQAR